jgi:hypothetical protein
VKLTDKLRYYSRRAQQATAVTTILLSSAAPDSTVFAITTLSRRMVQYSIIQYTNEAHDSASQHNTVVCTEM